MAKLLNADYWKNAYLLEFKLNEVLTDAFTFSVPPESEEFIFPQRKSETKTFGGAVVADYGNDLVSISLSGSTINQELKLIYKSSLGYTEMTGEQEAFYLRDLLKKYGSNDKLQNKEVYLYSLNGGGNKTSHNPKWWKIFVGQLDISRSKDKPFCYNYKFSATGLPEVTRKTPKLSKIDSAFESFSSAVVSIAEEMTDICNQINEYGGEFLSELSGYIGTLNSCIDIFNGSIAQYVSMVSGVINDTSYLITDSLTLGDKVLFSATRYYTTLKDDVWNSCQNVVEAAKKVGDYCANLDETYSDDSAWFSIQELYDESVSQDDIADVFSTLGHEEVKLANKLNATISKNLNDVSISVIPGDTGEDDEAILSYGYKVVALSDAETNWDQLAQDYYGDASLSTMLAVYNNLPTDQELEAGQSVLIPNLNFAENKAAENEVYNSPDVKDNYGKDLIINDKDFDVYNGDIAPIEGVDNLEQALLNRYSTLIGARIRLEAYGIQASIGDALNATSALIQASVHQTTVEDPRVDSVEDISFVGKGDNLTVSVIYIDKNGAKRNFGGTI